MNIYKVQTIYPASMGEVNTYGIGCPCTFLRLSGCNLRCYEKTKGLTCDTPEALCATSGEAMTLERIISKVNSYGNKVVCLTGGEPLIHDVTELLIALTSDKHKVIIETNGSKSIEKYRHIRDVHFVVDCKGPSSGMEHLMFERNYELLDKDDFIKFVIDDWNDYDHFKEWLGNHEFYLRCCVAVGLFWGSKLYYQELLRKLQEDGITNVYLNMQTHKMACLYDSMKETPSFSQLIIPKDL